MSQPHNMLTIIRQGRCAGWVLDRGPRGYESFNDEESSLGVYRDRDDAIDAVMRSDTKETAG